MVEDGDPITAAVAVECSPDEIRVEHATLLTDHEKNRLPTLDEATKHHAVTATIGDEFSEGLAVPWIAGETASTERCRPTSKAPGNEHLSESVAACWQRNGSVAWMI